MKKILLVIVAFTLLGQTQYAKAREVKMTGGLSTSYDYFKRQQKETTPTDAAIGGKTTVLIDNANDESRKIIVRPLISLQTLSEKDALEIRYEPGFSYDDINDEHDINHKASFAAQRLLSKKWKVLLSDNYEIKDDANQTEVAVNNPEATNSQDFSTEATVPQTNSDQLTTTQGRRRYTTNNLQFLSGYEYLEDSSFDLGYTNIILRNDDNAGLGYQDYDKHDALLGLGYRFNTIWKMSFAGHYIKGIFDTQADTPLNTAALVAEKTVTGQNDQSTVPASDLSDDVTEYHTAFDLEFSRIPHQPLSLAYSRVAYDYESELQDDTEIHNLTLGWQWQYSPHLTFNAGGGPSYAVTDNQEDTWSANGNLGTGYKLERGNVSLAIEKGIERQNFTGETVDNGLIDYWDGRANFSYSLLESTTVSLFAGYRYENQDEVMAGAVVTSSTDTSALQTDTTQINTITTERFTTGCSLTYSFWQWYALDLSYSYADQISERPEDEYDEHRVMLTLSFAKDFFHW